jgi:hypothetical protein
MSSNKTISKIDNIKSLWKLLPNDGSKTAFMVMLADDLGRKPNTLKHHWFTSFWGIPEQFQDRVITLLQNTIREKGIEIQNA